MCRAGPCVWSRRMIKESPVARVQVSSSEKYIQQIEARQHRLGADEGTNLGGSDSGPNPYELLLSGLGACTSTLVLG